MLPAAFVPRLTVHSPPLSDGRCSPFHLFPSPPTKLAPHRPSSYTQSSLPCTHAIHAIPSVPRQPLPPYHLHFSARGHRSRYVFPAARPLIRPELVPNTHRKPRPRSLPECPHPPHRTSSTRQKQIGAVLTDSPDATLRLCGHRRISRSARNVCKQRPEPPCLPTGCAGLRSLSDSSRNPGSKACSL